MGSWSATDRWSTAARPGAPGWDWTTRGTPRLRSRLGIGPPQVLVDRTDLGRDALPGVRLPGPVQRRGGVREPADLVVDQPAQRPAERAGIAGRDQVAGQAVDHRL